MAAFASTIRRSFGLGSSPTKVATQQPPSPPKSEHQGMLTTPASKKGNIRTLPANSVNPLSASTSPASPHVNNASPVLASLMLENSHGQDKVAYPIRKAITKIGRLPTNDIRIYRETVSRVHCQIVIDPASRSHATLHVLNPRGVKVNGKDVEGSEKGSEQRRFVLREGDRIEIYRNYFRMCFPSPSSSASSATTSAQSNDEKDLATNGQKTSSGSPTKTLRMSLVRASRVPVPASSPAPQSSPSASLVGRKPLSELKGKHLPEQRTESVSSQQPAIPATSDVFSSSSSSNAANTSYLSSPVRSVPKKGRRSLVFGTPKREMPKDKSWTAEPIKRTANYDKDGMDWEPELGDVKDVERPVSNECEEHVVVMEEMYDDGEEFELEPPIQAAENESSSQKQDCAQQPTTPEPQEQDKENLDGADGRLTKSSSPTKKARRRSSFFGRAGVFGTWNFGFYPEERKEEAQRDEDQNVERPQTPVTSPNGSSLLPEPRLDGTGRPRLPRSLSSPDGTSYTSPKRRVVSLRTATLLRQGQQAYEQQKLRSPPSSPTKVRHAESAVSLMDAMRRMISPSPPPSAEHESANEEDEEVSHDRSPVLTAGLSSVASDADDEDEVNRSLTMEDESDIDKESVEEAGSSISARRDAHKSRRSESTALSLSKSHSKVKRPRTSMPAKLVSISLVDGHAMDDIEDLKAQWLAEQDCEEANTSHESSIHEEEEQERHSDTESELDDSRSMTHVQGEQSNSRQEDHGQVMLPPSPDRGVKFGMLRYMVREDPGLSALLDSVVNEGDSLTSEKEITDGDHQLQVSVKSDTLGTSVIQEVESEGENNEGGWQIVSPRRAKWKPVERSTANSRRVSEGQRDTNASPEKRSNRRRITAAASLASAPPSKIGQPVDEAQQHARRSVGAERTHTPPKEVQEAVLFASCKPTTIEGRRASEGTKTKAASQMKKVQRRITAAPSYVSAPVLPFASRPETTSPSSEKEMRAVKEQRKAKVLDALTQFPDEGRRARRASEGPKAILSSPNKKSKRRVTATPSLASVPDASVNAEAEERENESDLRIIAEEKQGEHDSVALEVKAQAIFGREARKATTSRRASEAVVRPMPVSPVKKTKRRTTAAPSALLYDLVAVEKVENVEGGAVETEEEQAQEAVEQEEEDGVGQASTPRAPSTQYTSHPVNVPGAQSPSKRSISPDDMIEQKLADEQAAKMIKSPKKSPSKRARQQETSNVSAPFPSSTELEIAPILQAGRPRKPRAAKTAAVEAILNSPNKQKTATATTNSVSGRPIAAIATKQVRAKTSKSALQEVKNASKSLSDVTSNVASTADEADDEEHGYQLSLSSSPSKRTRRAILLQKQACVMESDREDDKENSSPAKARATRSATTQPTSKQKRGKQALPSLNQVEPLAASEPVKGSEEQREETTKRTTRSGRAVRKPTDRGEPATVVAQTDPVPTGRITRSRTRAR